MTTQRLRPPGLALHDPYSSFIRGLPTIKGTFLGSPEYGKFMGLGSSDLRFKDLRSRRLGFRVEGLRRV